MHCLKVAVVGSGIGRSHINAYKLLPEQFDVRILCDIDRAKGQTLAAECGIPEVLTDYSELCKRGDIDVINICTPPHLHFAQCQQALESGKHAICEKPLVGSIKDVDALIEIEARSGRRLMPIFQYRWGHGVQKLKYLIEAGLAGKAYLTTVETAWRRRSDYYAVPWRGKWKSELGGCLLGHAIHGLDGMQYISGKVKNVFARTATRVNPIETEDCASVSMEMADGSLASLSVTLGSPEEITRHRFCFSGFVAESNTRPYSNNKDPWTFTGDSPEIQTQIDAALSRFVPQHEGFEGQFTRFYNAIEKGESSPVTLADARSALELVTAMYYSASTHQPVELPINSDHPKYASWLP